MIDFTQMKAFSEEPLILTEGDGVRVRDVDGKWYFDGLSGTFCLSLGHGNAQLVAAATSQLSRLALAAPTMATSDRSLELARDLLSLLPPQYTTLKWGSSGSEAVEAAIKMARQFHRQAGDPRKYKVLSHYRAYHGVTGHALAASGWRASRSPYEPLAAGFVHLHTPDPYRPPFDVDPAEVGATYVRLVEQVIELEGPETIAALITEPILMSAGVVIPPPDYPPALRALCDRHDIVLVFDEIITGFGRTGRLFASELTATWPDILVFGKGLTGGYVALSATVITDRLRAPSGDPPGSSSQPATRTPETLSRAQSASRRCRRCVTSTWWRTPPPVASRRSNGCARCRRASRESGTFAGRVSCSASSSCAATTPRSGFPSRRTSASGSGKPPAGRGCSSGRATGWRCSLRR